MLCRATEIVPENTEFVILSEDPASQTVVLQSSTDGQIIPAHTQEENSSVVVSNYESCVIMTIWIN